MKKSKALYLLLAVLLVSTVGSCKKDKDDTTTTYVYTTSTSSTLVLTFALENNSEVLTNLNKVFFTIDPERNLIYNADSLPVGTDISSLKTTMTFRSGVKSAVFHVQDENKVTTDHEYTSNSSAAMDFRYGVTLTVTSADGLNIKEYAVKVNVHKQEPDSIVWAASLRRDLPGAADDNDAVSTTVYSGKYWCLLHNNNGYYLSSAHQPTGPWDVKTVAWGFEPDARTLSSSKGALYVLDGEGNLYSSSDGASWTATGQQWTAILGAYEDRLLGITTQPYCYAEYPQRSDFTSQAIDEKFPVKGMSQLIEVEPTWALAPQAMIVSGVLADGSLSSATWGYDGHRWAVISSNQNGLPALEGPTMFAYQTYSIDESTWTVTKHDVWMLMGGRKADGTLNAATYVSQNLGITWTQAANALCQPSTMPPFYGARAHVHWMTIKASKAPARRISQISDSWECPYIFIFGGYNSQGQLHNSIWQGVLTRLTQKPLY